MFTAAQFTIAKCWKQPKCPSVNEWIRKLWQIFHNGILHSRKKEGTPTLHNSMGRTGEYYVSEISQAVNDKYQYDLTYKWNLMNKINKQAK